MTAALPRVTILVLNYNRWRDTIECLESVFRIDYPNWRVVVCDNASTDDSLDRIRDWANGRLAHLMPADNPLRVLSEPPVAKPIRYVEYDRAQAEAGGDAHDVDVPLTLIRVGSNRGFTGGNNVGLRYLLANGHERLGAEYVCLLNNDAVIAASCIRQLVDVAEPDESVGAVGGTMLEYSAPNVVQVAGGGWVSLWHGGTRANGVGAPRNEPPDRTLGFVSGCCMLVRLSTVARVGLLDERYFMYGDDTDWCVRMAAHGYRMAYARQAEIWHRGSGTAVRGSWTSDYYNVRSPLLFVWKFRPLRMPAAFAYSVYRCVLPKLVRGQWARLRAVGRAYADVFGAALRYRDDEGGLSSTATRS
jgi:GT2 family glycosyltransferase